MGRRTRTGENTIFRDFDVIGENVVIGESTTFGPFVKIGHGVIIGKRGCVEAGVVLPEGMIVNDRACIKLRYEDGTFDLFYLNEGQRCYYVDNQCVVSNQ